MNEPLVKTDMRDMFAAFALNGLVASGAYRDHDEAADKVAADAYWYADAMLAERNKEVQP